MLRAVYDTTAGSRMHENSRSAHVEVPEFDRQGFSIAPTNRVCHDSNDSVGGRSDRWKDATQLDHTAMNCVTLNGYNPGVLEWYRRSGVFQDPIIFSGGAGGVSEACTIW